MVYQGRKGDKGRKGRRKGQGKREEEGARRKGREGGGEEKSKGKYKQATGKFPVFRANNFSFVERTEIHWIVFKELMLTK